MYTSTCAQPSRSPLMSSVRDKYIQVPVQSPVCLPSFPVLGINVYKYLCTALWVAPHVQVQYVFIQIMCLTNGKKIEQYNSTCVYICAKPHEFVNQLGWQEASERPSRSRRQGLTPWTGIQGATKFLISTPNYFPMPHLLAGESTEDDSSMLWKCTCQ